MGYMKTQASIMKIDIASMNITRFSRMQPLGCLAFALLVAASALGQTITAIAPTSAAQGTANLLVTFTLGSNPPPPPIGTLPTSATLGANTGSTLARPGQYTVTAVFNIPASETIGSKNATIVFPSPPGTFTGTAVFQVTAGSGVVAGFTATPTSGTAPLAVSFTDASTGTITSRLWDFGDGTTSTANNPSHTYTNTGSYTVSLAVFATAGSNTLTRTSYVTVSGTPTPGGYSIVDTGQTNCFDNINLITAPTTGQPFYGQDAQFSGTQPSYTKSSDELTVKDNATGLTWQKSFATNSDGSVNKMTLAQAQTNITALNAANYGGYNDWRLPTIKELYSLITFAGIDPSGYTGTDTSLLTPFIDRTYFHFAYGSTNNGGRIIDMNYASSTPYVYHTMASSPAQFGVNFADGRIKGYSLDMSWAGPGVSAFPVQLVRGAVYGANDFVENGDSTITDRASGLMWTKGDSAKGLNWQEALAWAQTKNVENYLGHRDWRLPNAKELQSIVDYTRSPDTTTSAAIDPLFTCTGITNEAGKADFPFYWTSTTHMSVAGSDASAFSGGYAIYVAFGQAMGYMTGGDPSVAGWLDVHGAGAQRSDPKVGNPADYPQGHGPQGDAIRIYNYVRLVRTALTTDDSVGDGIPNAWRAKYFGGSGTTTNAVSCAACDADGDKVPNYSEYVADTNPTNARSYFHIQSVSHVAGFAVFYQSSASRKYTLYCRTNLTSGAWTNIPSQTDIPGSGSVDGRLDPEIASTPRFYRLGVRVP